MTFVSNNVLEMREPSILTKNLLNKNEKDKFGLAKHEVEKVRQFQVEEEEEQFQKKIEKVKKIRKQMGI